MKNKWSIRTRIILVCLIVLGIAGIFAIRNSNLQSASATTAGSLQDESGYWVTLVSGTENRACARMDSTVVGGNFSNEPVEVTGKAFEGADEILWLRVTDPNGVEGWIPASAARNSDNLIPTQEELRMKFWFDFAPGTCTDADFEAVVPVVTEAPIATEALAATEVPMAGLPVLPADVAIEKMVACGDIGKTAKWDASKSPFTGTEFVCGEDKFWDITRMFYEGVEYQIPVTENAAPVAQADVVTYTPVGNAVPLISKEATIGFFWVLNQTGPKEVVYPSQSTVLVTMGNGLVSSRSAMEIVMTSDGTQGNIFVDVCETAEDCKLTVSKYTPGHVGVTIVFAGKEKPAETLAVAINNMFLASNCGGSGCPEVIVHNDKKDPSVIHFEDNVIPEDVANLLVAPVEPFVSVAIVGEPPANARIIKINKKVVGHAYTCSGECSVSVPEGAGGTVACFPEGGTADGKAVNSGEIVSWNSADSDGGTPEDLNNTVLLNGNNIQITMIYMADLEPFMNVACGQ